jgi:hypothetical protein
MQSGSDEMAMKTATGHAEGGTVVQPWEAAIVFSADHEVHLLLPNGSDDDVLAENAVAATAIYIRWCKDKEWRAELLDWMALQRKMSD